MHTKETDTLYKIYDDAASKVCGVKIEKCDDQFEFDSIHRFGRTTVECSLSRLNVRVPV